ncbi:MAG: helix-turn-helix domain-containing protein [Clostridia bacterium]|nr:helix-turn-helix domain-containing protein [Clostridia bacterium]
MTRLSDLIKSRRKNAGLSLREFSDLCGLSHTYIKNLEDSKPGAGKEVAPTIDSLAKVAHALNMSLEDLLKESGYILEDKVKRFYPSNVKLIRGSKTYEDISQDIYLKTGENIDPFVYEDMEKGYDTVPSPLLIDILAKYAEVDSSFFYRKNTIDDWSLSKNNNPYKYTIPKKDVGLYIKDAELREFINNPANEEYLRLAKEFSDKKLKIKFIRNMLFNE